MLGEAAVGSKHGCRHALYNSALNIKKYIALTLQNLILIIFISLIITTSRYVMRVGWIPTQIAELETCATLIRVSITVAVQSMVTLTIASVQLNTLDNDAKTIKIHVYTK